MVRVGLLGYPNSGKTTLFNALSGLDAATGSHPYTTTDTNLGMARVVDPLLDRVGVLENSRKTTHSTLDLHDLPAVRAGTARSLGRGSDLDVMVLVLRGHDSEWVPADTHGTDPVAQAEELLVELALADFEVFDRRREKIVKEASADSSLRPDAEAIIRGAGASGRGHPLESTPVVRSRIAGFQGLGAPQPGPVHLGGQCGR